MNLTRAISIVAPFLASTLMPAFAQFVSDKGKMEGSIHRAASAARNPERVPFRLRDFTRPAPRLALGRLSDREARPVTRKPGLTPVGVNRPLATDAVVAGEWSVNADGRSIWRLTLTSEGAEALRVQFNDFHVDKGSVWLLGKDAEGGDVTIGPYSGAGPLGKGRFWSDMAPGESVTIVYEPGDGTSSGAVPFQAVGLSHRFPATKSSSVKADDISVPKAAAATCAVDVSCHPEYSEAASAVALMVFESDGSTYECSGSLISSASQPALPFFLTANHCISTASEAESLITFFNYQTTSCNGAKPTLSNSVRVTGATLIEGEAMALGDFTLLRLTSFPNIDVKVLGWTGDEIASNEQVTGISHPAGDYKRIALGQRARDVTIRFSDGARMPANKGYQVDWFEGVTQGGSSGSPLLVNVNGKTYLAGTLSAGPDVDDDSSTQVCRTNNLVASYGRFSAALPYLEGYLRSTDGGGAATPVAAAPVLRASALTFSGGQTLGRTTLTWQASGATRVQIRVDSPTGPALTGREAPTGSVTTGDWVSAGMTFYLQDASDGNSLGSAKTLASVQVAGTSNAGVKSGVITASPNPIVLTAGQTRATTTLNWRATGATRVQIRVNSATGATMSGLVSPTGSATTGTWVTNGMVFYLQDASDGNSSGSAKTLSTVRVTIANR